MTPFSQNETVPSFQRYDTAGLLMTPFRWVMGWLYFSAFWRRVILENKLVPDAAGYVGEKFNNFLPQSLLIKPVIAYLVSHPTLLYWKLIVFTGIEAVVGLCLLLGLLTRLAGLGVSALALGILLGAGWLGTTCLDEWQIGVMGVAGGIVIALAGGGPVSLDAAILRWRPALKAKGWFHWLGSAPFRWDVRPRRSVGAILIVAAGCLGLTLWTNQVFHGGVYGRLHNKSLLPHLTISQASIDPQAGELRFKVMRDEGADTYGSFLIGITLRSQSGQVIAYWNAQMLSSLPENAIRNEYVARVRTGPQSLVLPLGALAELRLTSDALKDRTGEYDQLELLDVSGRTWQAPVILKLRPAALIPPAENLAAGA